jgi:hypothetical protein
MFGIGQGVPDEMRNRVGERAVGVKDRLEFRARSYRARQMTRVFGHEVRQPTPHANGPAKCVFVRHLAAPPNGSRFSCRPAETLRKGAELPCRLYQIR